jgi:hypothetical protein
MEKKRYADFTAEEKLDYDTKRKAYFANRKAQAQERFALIETELVRLKANKDVLKALAEVKKLSGVEKMDGGNGTRTTYMSQLFGTETPTDGQTASYESISLRGVNGERMLAGESKKDFIKRMDGEVDFTKSAKDIYDICWLLQKRGINVTNDKEKALVTFNK